MLADFHSKYVNFRIEMPNMPVTLVNMLSEGANASTYNEKLWQHYKKEYEERGQEVANRLFEYYGSEISKKLDEIRASENYVTLKKNFNQH